MQTLLRHIEACNNTTLPGGRLRLTLSGHDVGWVAPETVEPMIRLGAVMAGGAVTLDAGALPGLAAALSKAGYCRWRGEAFDVRREARREPPGAVLAQVDRGALPLLGLCAEGVHVNGLVKRGGGFNVWLGRRAADKALDPGKLDQIVAGGVAAGLDAAQTLAKEAAEEAGLPGALAATATRHTTIHYTMQRPEGLRRDILHCYDLALPDGFVPHPVDGEVAGFELWPVEAVLDAVRHTNDFKFNVNLVLIDLFLRHGLVAGAEAQAVRTALDRRAD